MFAIDLAECNREFANSMSGALDMGARVFLQQELTQHPLRKHEILFLHINMYVLANK